ncbi:MAG: fibrobacter succinogenes major paralogous domain-containing protein [Fibrobacter sp.]|nr:fibrobacter succinogenes major paralogous domain-containing protein [Fibrobacter sp.]
MVIDNRDTVYIENGGSGSGNGGAGTGGNTSFGTLVDERDGQTYRTTKIGDQVWMAENLNFPVKGSYCYDNTLVNCEIYGRLYTWEAAQDVCPSGWHLPSKEDFDTLLKNVGESDTERFDNLAARSWKFGTDPYGFSALPAGNYNGTSFKDLGSLTYFWSSTSSSRSTDTGGSLAYLLRINVDDAHVSYYGKYYGGSVRCLQD